MKDKAVLLYLLEQHHMTSPDQELQHNVMLGSHAIQGNRVRPIKEGAYAWVQDGKQEGQPACRQKMVTLW